MRPERKLSGGLAWRAELASRTRVQNWRVGALLRRRGGGGNRHAFGRLDDAGRRQQRQDIGLNGGGADLRAKAFDDAPCGVDQEFGLRTQTTGVQRRAQTPRLSTSIAQWWVL